MNPEAARLDRCAESEAEGGECVAEEFGGAEGGRRGQAATVEKVPGWLAQIDPEQTFTSENRAPPKRLINVPARPPSEAYGVSPGFEDATITVVGLRCIR